MRALEYDRYGGISELVLRSVPDPRPRNGEIAVRVSSAAVAPIDWKVMRGDFRFLTGGRMPRRIGCDFSGVVAEVGRDVRGVEAGHRVFGCINCFRGDRGTMAEVVIARHGEFAISPPGLSFEFAAALSGSGASAWQCLELARATAGQCALIFGASGGVGSYAVQLAKIRGLSVSAVCSSRNVAAVRNLVVDHVMAYDQQDVLAIDERFDAVIDTVGSYSFPACRRLLKPRGHYVTTVPSGRVYGQVWRSRLSRGPRAHALMVRIEPAVLKELSELAIAGRIRPLIGGIYDLDHARDAFAQSMTGHAVGKLIVRVGSPGGDADQTEAG